MKSEIHDCPVVIAANNFKFKSLSCWAVNAFLGCSHGCRFCYVTDTSANKQKHLLASYGIHDPVADWGNYLLVRPWDEKEFVGSLKKAEKTPLADLNKDGNRAVMFSSTTDPYQVVRNPNAQKQDVLNSMARSNMRRSLEMILNYSTLNVRILTRSPLARQDFDLFKQFGNRLLLGVSLPTLDDKLSRIGEAFHGFNRRNATIGVIWMPMASPFWRDFVASCPMLAACSWTRARLICTECSRLPMKPAIRHSTRHSSARMRWMLFHAFRRANAVGAGAYSHGLRL